MATTAKKPAEKPAAAKPGTALQKATAPGVPAELMDDYLADAGAGMSHKADDSIVPFLVLLQDMSPEVKKRDPGYVQGAEPGMYMNRATKKLYAGDPETAQATGLPQLVFQPCWFDHAIVQWVPRTEGGGFVARHSLKDESVEKTMAALGAKQVDDPQDVNKKVWKSKDGLHDMIDTRYHFGNVVDGDDDLTPAVMAFSSTGHTASREWTATMKSFKFTHPQTGQKLVMPSWSREYVIGSKPRENKKGSFFVSTISDAGPVSKAVYAAGRELNKAADTGAVTASTDEGRGSGADTSGDGGI